jgi:hypothetical protein
MQPHTYTREFFVLTNESEDRFLEDGIFGWTTEDIEEAYRFKTAQEAQAAAAHLPIGLDRPLKLRETWTIEKASS